MDWMTCNGATLASIADWLGNIRPVLYAIIGLTAVIFVHELGHFTAAKLVGIRVERFAIGFGPRLFGWRGKETDYCINLFPLGGYVKMVGQEDFELEKERQPDPRAFNNKSVGARALVVAAGVTMNVIFAGLLFMVVFMNGKEFPAPQVGDVEFGSPAYGIIEPGDVYKEMDHQTVDDGLDAVLIPALTYGTEPMAVRVLRNGRDVTVNVDPQAAKVGPTEGLRTLGTEEDHTLTVADFPAAQADLVARLLKMALLSGRLDSGDVIVQAHAGDEPFRNVFFWSDLARMARDSAGQPVTLKIQRKDGTIHEAVLRCALRGPGIEAFQLLGAHPRIKVVGVSEKMPATGWLKEEDVIVNVGGIDYPLEGQVREAVRQAGDSELTLKILREGKELVVKIKPKNDLSSWLKSLPPQIGIAMEIDGDLAALGQVSADKALGNLPSGAEVLAVRLVTTRPDKAATSQPNATTRGETDHQLLTAKIQELRTVVMVPDRDTLTPLAREIETEHGPATLPNPTSRPEASSRPEAASQPEAQPLTWGRFYRDLVGAAGRRVTIEYRLYGKIATVDVDVPPLGDWQRGVTFRPVSLTGLLKPLTKLYRADNPIAAVGMGARKLSQMIVQVYVTLDRLIFRRSVSVKNLYGPIGIAVATYHTARLGMMDLLYFLAMISANLAVINFLPLPIVDGGLMIFLIAEKIRRKPVSVRVVQTTQVVGFVLIIAIFLMVMWQDIVRFILPWVFG